MPESEESVKSSMVGLKTFEYEFKLTTKFNNFANTETVIVKTSLIYVKEQGWKIHDVEFVGELTGRKIIMILRGDTKL
ncbi:hypothetical protein [Cytobacillus purgationiresistens]|uniref:Uncharacterized protein n=1 Tax=Cytobacillus purgationiresistens TaxID=863449 RepID=A0ABU0AJ16_9BACI|nr:hypothetical protein [Cytobacillus purgationiresistens]MDQ0271255.1 hypothetical protein [Cytobacillus purgationiresistens]